MSLIFCVISPNRVEHAHDHDKNVDELLGLFFANFAKSVKVMHTPESDVIGGGANFFKQ